MTVNQTLKSHKSGCSGRPANNCLSPMAASLIAQLVKNLPAMQETWVRSWVAKILWIETLWPVAHQAPLSMGFPRQEHWRGLPCPPPGDPPNPGMKPMSPMSPALQVDSTY